jgi:NADPH-dependent glutamate synthase beta subunit-like oxidoreductase
MNPGPGRRLTPSFRPRQAKKRPPCQANCPNCGDIRAWIGIVAQRQKAGITREQAYARAWRTITAVNPFPSVLGRICPHPCEAHCNRSGHDGALAINALERFLGDWAIAQGLTFDPPQRLDPDRSLGVVGSGPSGLSFAYQMARRGYRVSVYEEHPQPGGMLRYGVPDYRLPPATLDAEINRILDLGVELLLNTRVGRDVSLDELRHRHAALYLGLGAQGGIALGIPGEAGSSVRTGVDYLGRINSGQAVSLGSCVVVVGGGNTAIDAARTARRSGAAACIVYRRARADMPAVPDEIDEALAEGTELITHCAPVRILRAPDGTLRAVDLIRMRPGEPDASGRQRPVPVEGSEFTVKADSVITAISQAPVFEGLDQLRHAGSWLVTDAAGDVDDGMLAGGDVLGLGIAGNAIVQGRRAAERLHARLSRGGLQEPGEALEELIGPERILFEHKPGLPPVRPQRLTPDERLQPSSPEVAFTLCEESFLAEVERCYSCGECLGCEHCAMYCTKGSFIRLAEVGPGMYFSLALDACEECGKCIAVCPCGYLELTPEA